MEKVVSKIAGLGIPGLILLVAIDATGLVGAAALTTALAALGPGGMLGGVTLLVASGVILDGLAEWGLDAIFEGVVKELYANGETRESIKRKISKYPVSKQLKAKLYLDVDNFKIIWPR